MITIINRGPHDDPNGYQHYEIAINAKVVAEVKHLRSDGLSHLLLLASSATFSVKATDPPRKITQ